MAFVGDILKMFQQVMLRPQDTEVPRFLWRNLDSSREPGVYWTMKVTFGDKLSHAMASFVMLQIAKKFRITHPEAS